MVDGTVCFNPGRVLATLGALAALRELARTPHEMLLRCDVIKWHAAVAGEAAQYRRGVVERCVGYLKEYRAVAPRFDKLAVQFLTTIKLTMIRQHLKVFPDTA